MKRAPAGFLVVWTALAETPSHNERLLDQLLLVQRIYVDRMGGGEVAGHIRDMIINGIQRSGLFVITENQDKADAILRGSAEDLVYTDSFQFSDGINVRANVADSDGRSSSRGRRSAGVSVGEDESRRGTERKHEAAAAVRLVNRDGDVIWSSTQESLGAKFRGASADVADKIMRHLAEDYRRVQKRKGLAPADANPLPR